MKSTNSFTSLSSFALFLQFQFSYIEIHANAFYYNEFLQKSRNYKKFRAWTNLQTLFDNSSISFILLVNINLKINIVITIP